MYACLSVYVEVCDKRVWHVSLRKRETRQRVKERGHHKETERIASNKEEEEANEKQNQK